MAHTVLTGNSFRSDSNWANYSPLQSEVDGLVSRFNDEASNPMTLASIAAGGFAFRYGRMGVMGMGSSLFHRPLSFIVGLGAEVTAFELTHRSLQTLDASYPNGHRRDALHASPNLWSWNGPGDWKEGIVSTGMAFGTLRAAGFLARGQNLVLTHTFQSAAMVAGHHAVSFLEMGPRPEPGLALQFLHAEVTNLQMGTGLSLLHSLAPGLHAAERSLDFSLRHGFAGAVPFTERGRSLHPAPAEGPSFPSISLMSSNEGRNTSPPSAGERSETSNDPLRLFRKEMSRTIDRHIERHRSRWLGILTPEGVGWTDLIGRAIRSAQLYFGEKTLRVLVLKKENSPEALLTQTLIDEFGSDQTEKFDESNFRHKRILITTPSLLIPHLRSFGREKSTLLVLEDASDIFLPQLRILATHFGLASSANSSRIHSIRGNGMILGFSDTLEGLDGFLLSSPKELSFHSSPPSETPPMLPPPSPRASNAPIPSAPPLPTGVSKALKKSGPVLVRIEAKSSNNPQTPKEPGRPKTVVPDMKARIDAFWKAHGEALAQETQGTPMNRFKVGQQAWQIYLISLGPENRRVQEHFYLQSLVNHSGDDRIVEFLAEIGIRKRAKK